MAGILGPGTRLTSVAEESPGTTPAIGEVAEVEITDVTSEGDGIGRSPAGLVLMIAGAVPGDRVRARLTRRHRGYAEALLETLLERSPDRVEPRCVHFGQCGGCALQNLSPEAQRRVKHTRLTRLLARPGDPAPPVVEEVREVGPPYGFRGRMEFSFGGPAAMRRIGLHARAGDVFPLRECHLPDPAFARIVTRLDAALRGAPDGRGLRRLEIRRAAHDGRLLVTLRADGEVPEALLAALRRLEAEETAVGGVLVAPASGTARLLWGREAIEDVVLDLRLAIGPDGFVQTHPAGAEALYREVLRRLRPRQGMRFLDLYSGLGIIGMAAARQGAEVLCIESSAPATRAAEQAAAANRVRLRVLRGEVTRSMRHLAGTGERFAAACLNPPRAGISAALPDLLAATGVRTLAYVSCHPATLARDAARLKAAGYEPARVVPFDFFPQTAQVECAAFFGAGGEGGFIDAGDEEG